MAATRTAAGTPAFHGDGLGPSLASGRDVLCANPTDHSVTAGVEPRHGTDCDRSGHTPAQPALLATVSRAGGKPAR